MSVRTPCNHVIAIGSSSVGNPKPQTETLKRFIRRGETRFRSTLGLGIHAQGFRVSGLGKKVSDFVELNMGYILENGKNRKSYLGFRV